MRIEDLLRTIIDKKASDGFITAGAPLAIKVDGQVYPISEHKLTEDEARALVLSAMNERQQREFLGTRECNFAVAREGLGRFRASALVQRGRFELVLRRIETEIPEIDDLGLPRIVKDLAMTKRGLVIFVGATGTGKTTSLAAMVGYRNQNSRGHIISIEDPIEFIHEHGNCLVTQREVGVDTESFDVALKNTLRQAPDVILIGEVRSAETMSQALTFAETGHLCLCTLHANNANQALDRILSFFPPEMHHQVWMDLSLNLKAMVAQQLLPRKDGKGRTPVVEVLLNTPLVQDYIRKGEVHLIKDLMAKSTELGMQTLDQSLIQSYKNNLITVEDALRFADSANEVRLAIKMIEKARTGFDTHDHLSYDEEDRGRHMGR